MTKVKTIFKFKKKVYDDDWKWIYMNGEKTNYQIHKNGKVSTTNFNNTGKPGYRATSVNQHGYAYVAIHHKGEVHNALIHRLVALAFIPKIKGKPFVNHIDGNKLNNKIENLEWVTAEENIQHAYRTGLIKVGDESVLSKYDEKIIRKICNEFVKNKLSMVEISQKYNVSYNLVYDLKRHKIWHHIIKDYDYDHYNKKTRAPKYGEYNGRTKLTNEDVENICKLISEGEWTLKGIAAKYNTTYKTIQHIYNKDCWKHITSKYDFSNYVKSNERNKNI